MRARCGCGALVATTTAEPLFAIACHCIECQRRTGAPLGAGVYYQRDAVAVSGSVSQYARCTDSGGTMRTGFCPTCATSLLWTIDAHPELIGIALGTIEDRDPPLGIDSLWERSKHPWISLDTAIAHHPMGYPAPE